MKREMGRKVTASRVAGAVLAGATIVSGVAAQAAHMKMMAMRQSIA